MERFQSGKGILCSREASPHVKNRSLLGLVPARFIIIVCWDLEFLEVIEPKSQDTYKLDGYSQFWRRKGLERGDTDDMGAVVISDECTGRLNWTD